MSGTFSTYSHVQITSSTFDVTFLDHTLPKWNVLLHAPSLVPGTRRDEVCRAVKFSAKTLTMFRINRISRCVRRFAIPMLLVSTLCQMNPRNYKTILSTCAFYRMVQSWTEPQLCCMNSREMSVKIHKSM